MADFRFRLNPRAPELPHCSAVLNGRGTRYEVDGYRTTLSLKSVVRGAARYHTPQGHYLLTPDSFLILNDGQRYSLEFEGGGRVQTETLCPFFQRGFLEQAAAGDLDDIDPATPALDFCERLYPRTGSVARALADLHAGLRGPHPSTPWLEDRMYALAQSLTVSAAARVATLSPFHFQRMFKLAFGQTPMQFLQQTRLEAARRLLAHTGDGITAICFAVGFESPGSFSWLFRKRFGVSPRGFRENRRIEEASAGAVA